MMSSDFSRNLTKYRRRCSLTQSQLAAQLNVIPQAVSNGRMEACLTRNSCRYWRGRWGSRWMCSSAWSRNGRNRT